MIARFFSLIEVGAVGALTLASCSTSQPSPAPITIVVAADYESTSTASPDVRSELSNGEPNPAPKKAAPPSADPPESESRDAAIPMLVGCSSFAPIMSQDPCGTASDCAPSAPCHAKSCTTVAKAPQSGPSTMCTMSLVCSSMDVGKCDCVDGFCALVPR